MPHIDSNLDLGLDLPALGEEDTPLFDGEDAPLLENLEVDKYLGPATQELAFSIQEVQQAARQDLDFLAGLAMPTVFQYCYPPVFIAVWSWLVEYGHKVRDFSQLALGLPRGFGKTTLIKLYILYCILFTQKKFILVISSTATLAQNIVADVMDMLEEPNIKGVFGDWKLGMEKDTQGLKKFGFRGRNIIFAGIGAGTSLRGMNLKNERPDVMIFEDFQTRENADSVVQSDALLRWMVGTAMKAKSPHGCQYIFVANMYPTQTSILRKLKANPRWIKFIAGGILSDFTSLWEELQPITQLMEEFNNDLQMGHPEIFYAEVLNDENASTNNYIDISNIPQYPFSEGEISGGNFIIIDPATDKPGSDEVSIGYFEVLNGYPVLKSLIEDRLSPGETIRKSLEIALTNNCRAIGIESTAYQYSLLYWFNFMCAQMGITGIEPLELYSGVTSKNSRILSMFKSLLAGEEYIHPSCTAPVYLQITSFNALKRDNTDGLLDLLTYAPKMIELYGEYIASYAVIAEQSWAGDKELQVQEFNSPF